MKTNIWLLTILLSVAVSPAFAFGAADKRLDQKITFDAPNARLHDVVDTIADKSKVTIYCGSTADDWRVRDIPVTVAARGITLRKLLEYLAFSTHTCLSETASDKGRVYRIWRDAKQQKVFDDFQEVQNDYQMACSKRSLEIASMLKDIPASDIKAPKVCPSGWSDNLLIKIEASKLLAALDSKTIAQLSPGKPLLLSPHTAPAGLREVIRGYLRAIDARSIKNSRASDKINLRKASASELEDGRVKIILKQPDVTIYGNVSVQGIDGQSIDRFDFASACDMAELVRSNNVIGLTLPKQEFCPENPKLEMPNQELKSFSDAVDLQKVVDLNFSGKKPVWLADALIALSKETGLSIVCEDFQTHLQMRDLRKSLTNAMPIADMLRNDPSETWMADEKEKVLVGVDYFWGDSHKNLIPKRVVENIKAKAGGEGVDVEDLASLSAFSVDAVYAWFPDTLFRGFPRDGITQMQNKPLWMLYSSLSAHDKAVAKSGFGLEMGDSERKTITPWLQEMIASDSDEIYQRKPKWYKMADPAAVPKLIMRVKSNPEHTSEPIKRHDCWLMLEGITGKENVALSFCGARGLPYFTPEREKQLEAALKANK